MTKEKRVDWSKSRWWTWIGVTVTSWAIWLLVLITDKDHPTSGFWPLWVMVPFGLVTFFWGRPTKRRDE